MPTILYAVYNAFPLSLLDICKDVAVAVEDAAADVAAACAASVELAMNASSSNFLLMTFKSKRQRHFQFCSLRSSVCH